LSESVNPWVYSLQFLFKYTNKSWRYERKCEWVFFLNTVYILTTYRPADWIEQCFTSPPAQCRLYGRRFLQVKRPNQQYHSTEVTYNTQTNQTNKET